jgi:MFS transporter, Spinster family, sphingosine-1-phosphate transporter
MTNKKVLLVLLTAIVIFNYVDRLALGVLLQDIKIDLSLSDTQLGFLTGISFALFYAIMGIPIARWADRGNRVTIITLTTAIWSICVGLCGAAANFMQLMLVRVGVAVGEAGCHPPALSLISDYFSRAERPRIVSRYLLGWPLALVIGNFAAGWLNELYGWRATFVILGLPGLMLAALAALFIKEPRRMPGRNRLEATPRSRERPFGEVVAALWRNTPYRHMLFCQSVTSFFTYGIMQWQPAFFVRSYDLQTGELGAWLALVYGAGGLLGTYVGGELAFKRAANNERLQLRAVAVLMAMSTVLLGGAYLAPSHYIAFALLTMNSITGAATNGPIMATSQTFAPPEMRAISVALVLFFSNLIGMGFGPLGVGVLSDAFRPWLGDESLRYALVLFCPGYLWAAWHAWKASITAREVAAAVAAEDVPESEPGVSAEGEPNMNTARS